MLSKRTDGVGEPRYRLLEPLNQGTIKDGCSPNVRVPVLVCWYSQVGFLRIVTYKYPRDVKRLYRDFPLGGPRDGIGVHPCLSTPKVEIEWIPENDGLF